jgi:small membrane protein
MTIQTNQIVLLAAVLIFILYVFRVRSTVSDRAIFLLFAAGGMILVLRPDLATRIAHSIHIGRGTDLLLYVFILFSLFNYVGIASELKAIERRTTEIVRQIAISEAREGQMNIEGSKKTSA